MSDLITAMLNNHVLLNAGIAWLVSQAIKISLIYFKEKKLNLALLMRAGGMPSTHTAIVVAMTTTVGRDLGWDDPLFGVSAAISFIVMYDAAGVRRAVGKQAVVVNQLLDDIYKNAEISRERLKELLGHKPIEVFAGALLGIALAFVF